MRTNPVSFVLIIIISIVLTATVSNARPKMAIIIDDFGYSSPNDNVIRDFANLDEIFSVSVIPHTPFASKIDCLFNKTGKEILIHLPLESFSRVDEEKSTILLEMTIAQVKQSVKDAVENVPHAVGISNHQGSAFTSDSCAMDKLTEAIFDRTVYFIDSRTTTTTIAYDACRTKGIPAFNRDIFLDSEINDGETISDRFSAAVKIAERQGYVIVVGHRTRTTFIALKEFMKSPLRSRVELVYPSQILNFIKQ